MSKQKPSLARGTRDFGPAIAAKRNYIIEVIKKNFKKYGFNQLETPALENLSTLTGKYGDEGDQLLFKVLNSGDFLSKTTPEDITGGSKSLTPKIAEKGKEVGTYLEIVGGALLTGRTLTRAKKDLGDITLFVKKSYSSFSCI